MNYERRSEYSSHRRPPCRSGARSHGLDADRWHDAPGRRTGFRGQRFAPISERAPCEARRGRASAVRGTRTSSLFLYRKRGGGESGRESGFFRCLRPAESASSPGNRSSNARSVLACQDLLRPPCRRNGSTRFGHDAKRTLAGERGTGIQHHPPRASEAGCPGHRFRPRARKAACVCSWLRRLDATPTASRRDLGGRSAGSLHSRGLGSAHTSFACGQHHAKRT